MAGGTVRVPTAGLDAIQQSLFAIALGLRTLRTGAGIGTIADELERLEAEVDVVIRDVRDRASGPSR